MKDGGLEGTSQLTLWPVEVIVINVIELNTFMNECVMCGRECRGYGVGYCYEPTQEDIGSESVMYPGEEVCGMPACQECHDKLYYETCECGRDKQREASWCAYCDTWRST